MQYFSNSGCPLNHFIFKDNGYGKAIPIPRYILSENVIRYLMSKIFQPFPKESLNSFPVI